MKLKKIIFIAVAMLVITCFAPVYVNAQPPVLPHAFYGTLQINDSDAPVETVVKAKGEGVTPGLPDNPIVTDTVGEYGGAGGLDPKLVVQGEGITEITFWVNDYQAEILSINGDPAPAGTKEYGWQSGAITELDLTVDIPTDGDGDGGGGGGIGAPKYYLDTNLFGIEERYRISDDGEVQETIEVTSEDGMITITIPEDTIALDEDGNRLETLEISIDETPPDPPEDAHIIGLAYDFEPDGATFEPPITFEYTYDPADIPEGVAEEDLVLAYYDEDTGEWVELDCVVDTENNIITALVEHLTTFAIIAPPPSPTPALAPAAFTSSSLSISPLEVDIDETINIGISVTNSGEEEGSYTVTLKIEGVVEETREVTLAGGASETVTFTTAKDEAGAYAVDVDGLTGSFTVREAAVPSPVAPIGVNWAMWGPIIAVAIFLAIFLPIRLRRRRAG